MLDRARLLGLRAHELTLLERNYGFLRCLQPWHSVQQSLDTFQTEVARCNVLHGDVALGVFNDNGHLDERGLLRIKAFKRTI